ELLVMGLFALVVARTQTLVLLVAEGAIAVVEGGGLVDLGVLLALRVEQGHDLLQRKRTVALECSLEVDPNVLGVRVLPQSRPVFRERIRSPAAPRGDGERRLQYRLPHRGGTTLQGAQRESAPRRVRRGGAEPRTGTSTGEMQVLQRVPAEGALHRGVRHLTAGAGDDDRSQRRGTSGRAHPEFAAAPADPRGIAVGRAVHPLPVRELVEVPGLAGDDESRGDEVHLARPADASAGRWGEVPMGLQIVAFGTGVHQRETADPKAVLAAVVGRRRKSEEVDVEQPGQSPLMNDGRLVLAPAAIGLVQARDDEGLVVDGDERPDSVRVDHLGPADRSTAGEVAGRGGAVRRGPTSAGGGRGHRLPSMNRADSASTSRRLHSVGHAWCSSASSYDFRSEGARLPGLGSNSSTLWVSASSHHRSTNSSKPFSTAATSDGVTAWTRSRSRDLIRPRMMCS